MIAELGRGKWAELLFLLAEMFSALWLEIFWGWNLAADDVQTTCRWCADDMRMMCGRHESETSLEISAGGWHMSSGTSSAGRYVIRTSSTGMYVIRMLSAGTYVIRTSSAELLMVSMDLNYLSTVTGTGCWMEFFATMLSCFISGSCKWFAT